jgi:hypothetical protein
MALKPAWASSSSVTSLVISKHFKASSSIYANDVDYKGDGRCPLPDSKCEKSLRIQPFKARVLSPRVVAEFRPGFHID